MKYIVEGTDYLLQNIDLSEVPKPLFGLVDTDHDAIICFVLEKETADVLAELLSAAYENARETHELTDADRALFAEAQEAIAAKDVARLAEILCRDLEVDIRYEPRLQ